MMKRLYWLFLSILTCASLLGSSSFGAEIGADQLNQQGFIFLHQGNAAAALEIWQRATAAYRSESDHQGIRGSQVNQAMAKQMLGLYPAACFDLAEVLSLPSKLCKSDIQMSDSALEQALTQIELSIVNQIGLRLLGENFRFLGNPHRAESILLFLQDALGTDSPEKGLVTLALGSAYQMSVQEELLLLSRLGSSEAKEANEALSTMNTKIQQAVTQYKSSAAENPSIATHAYLNILNLFSDTNYKVSNLPSLIRANIDLSSLHRAGWESYLALQNESFDQLFVNERIEAQLSLSNSLLTIRRMSSYGQPWNSIDFAIIESLASDAVDLAAEAGNRRALSSALGLLADISEYKGVSLSDLELLRKQALSTAQSIQADDLAYEWAYKLAKVYESQGNTGAAHQSYRQAIASLTQVRQDLIAVNSELRFNFKEKIEVVYRDYLRFLLSSGQQDLSQAVRLYESLQLAELENFLRCGRLVASSRESQAELTVYVINLETTIEVIVSSSEGYYGYSLPAESLLKAAQNLARNVASPSFRSVDESEFLPYAQTLYTDLIQPLEEASLISEATTLTFVLDYPFQSIPMGILHDGKDYLVQRHAVINSVRLNRGSQRSMSSRALFAGLIQETNSDDPRILSEFGVLPETEFEAEALKSVLHTELLIDDKFTQERLKKALETNEYSVVHISTHGQFSSVPEETFLVTWDELIDLPNLAVVFQNSRGNLLFLSACKTASGDERAVLGISGVAVQAGVHSAIASLWLVDATGSSTLVDLFYQGLDRGLEISEALHEAQLSLLRSSAFSHPFYWAPFILVQG